MTGHVIAVTGGKGGVGKSTTTINLGVSLRMDGYTVALVDADVEMPNLMEMLGIQADYTIHDVLSGTAGVAQATVKIGQGFAAIPGDSALSSYGSIEPERLNTVVDTLATSYDYVLLDTGAGLSYDDLFPIGLADEIILVSSPDSAAVENAKRTQSFVRRLNRRVRGVVITKANDDVTDALVRQFDTELLGVIPRDEAVSRSTAAGKPLELIAPDSPATQGYRQLEAKLTDGKLPPGRSNRSPAGNDSPERSAGRDRSAGDGGLDRAPDRDRDPDAGGDGSTDDDDETDDTPPRKRSLVGRIASLVT